MDPNFLREATRAEHEATEAMMPLMGPGLTLALYRRVLETLWPIVHSWETWAAINAAPELQDLLWRRRRAPMLAADLQQLGIAENKVAGPDWDAVVFSDNEAPGEQGDRTARVIGAMYVMEGSTLGGRFIARYVEEHLGLAPGEGNRYFRGHEEATGAMWREFREQVTAVPAQFDAQVEASSKRTFRAFGHALQAGLALGTGDF